MEATGQTVARQNLTTVGTAPRTPSPLRLTVLRRDRPTPGFARVTLGGPDAARLEPLGFDQWGRLFLPAEDGSLDRVPDKLDLVSYVRMQAARAGARPVLRNVSIRSVRYDGDATEIDVELVVHDHGRASSWAQECEPGDEVVFLDMGTGFSPPAGARDFRLVCDESGLPALASILASLPVDATGTAWAEVAAPEDRRDLDVPAGLDLVWLVRSAAERPGEPALRAVTAERVVPGFQGWAAGEQQLASGARRHWVGAGVPKQDVSFCGYWRAGR